MLICFSKVNRLVTVTTIVEIWKHHKIDFDVPNTFVKRKYNFQEQKIACVSHDQTQGESHKYV